MSECYFVSPAPDWQQKTCPEKLARDAVENGKVVTLEFVIKNKLVRDDTNFVSQFTPAEGQGVDMKSGRFGLPTV